MTHQAEQYLAAGMDAVVARPIEIAALIGALNRVISPGEPADEASTSATG